MLITKHLDIYILVDSENIDIDTHIHFCHMVAYPCNGICFLS